MAVMDAVNRARTAAGFMREVDGPYGFTKPQLAAAVAAADQWCEDNQASFLAALPAGGFKAGSTAAQKALLLCYVIMRRVGRLRVTEDS